MKLLIASDLHGSKYYCEKLFEAFKSENADRILLLGDLLYHGPRNDLPKEYNPKAVLAMLNENKTNLLCVRGNCDAEVDQMVLEFPVLADYCILPIGSRIIYASHGHVYNEKNMLPLKKGDIFLHGHTHVPRCDMIDEVLFLNPGSASMPKENSHNGYMIFENDTFYWKDFDGNIISAYPIVS